jgi:hemoglobin
MTTITPTTQASPESAPQRVTTLFRELGGANAVKAVVGELYQRLLFDQVTAPFFKNSNMASLKMHQAAFLKIAFTAVPDSLDVPTLMMTKHMHLFKEGLTEHHFDVVAGHFIASCRHLDIDQELIDAAIIVITSLRVVFEQGARKYGAGNAHRGCACM